MSKEILFGLMCDTPARLELVSVVSIEVQNKKESASRMMEFRKVNRLAGVQLEQLLAIFHIHLPLLKKKSYYDSNFLPILRTAGAAWCNRYVAKVASEAIASTEHHKIVYRNPHHFFTTSSLLQFCQTRLRTSLLPTIPITLMTVYQISLNQYSLAMDGT
jgi:hypothetical protein